MGIVNRSGYITAAFLTIALGVILILFGDPKTTQQLVSQEMFNYIFPNGATKPVTILIAVGVIISVLGTVIAFGLGLVIPFSRKNHTPKRIDVLRAQNLSIFLIDGKVYEKDEAKFYNLTDLSRLKIVTTKNLYFLELESFLSITPEPEKEQNENFILHRDSEGQSSESRNNSNSSE